MDLNASIRDIPLPERMKRLPIDERGYPVPWFVAKIDGKWDFRAIEPGRMAECYNKRRCWLCGDTLGQYLCFVIGPMCSVNRINSEPPSHLECARYAVRACPFLTQPRMRRNEKDLPGGSVAGVHLDHNPGAMVIWVTRSYKAKRVQGGILFELGAPVNTLWYCRGHTATRAEVLQAFNKGLPTLRGMAAQEGRASMRELEKMIDIAMKLVPAETADV